MLDIAKKVEVAIVAILLALMLVTLIISTVELAIIMYDEFMSPPKYLFGLQDLLEVLGFFLMVLIALELLETIKAYLEHKSHLEVVVVVAMIAIARKIIIIDYKSTSPQILYGMAAVILALAVGYYLVKRARDKSPNEEAPRQEGEKIKPSFLQSEPNDK